MKHANRFGGKTQRTRIRIRILRSVSGFSAGAVISPPAGAAQILLARKDQLGRPVAIIEPEPKPTPQPEPKPEVKQEVKAPEVKKPNKK